jgi:hypothetical protein
VGDKRTAYRVFVQKPHRRSHFESLGVDGRIILKRLKETGWQGVALVWLRTETGGGLL